MTVLQVTITKQYKIVPVAILAEEDYLPHTGAMPP